MPRGTLTRVAGVLCPVVCGRDDEMRTLQNAFVQASAGRGSLAFITGEPGIGKSRLVRELTGHARGAGAIAVTGRAVPGGSSTPYRPLTEALLQILRDRSEDAVASAVARAEGVIRLIRWLGAEAGLLIVLEDLHWADPDTLAVLEYLADNVGGERVLFVATSRDEPHSDGAGLARRLADRRAVTRLSLGRLGADDVERMVRACLAGADDDLVARAQLAADGVPFLVEEVLASPGVPDSFAAMVRVRLAGFSPDERRVLEAAALLGRSFDWQLLAAASGTEPAVVSASLERAVASQLLAPRRRGLPLQARADPRGGRRGTAAAG
jgi:predicted ATPase